MYCEKYYPAILPNKKDKTSFADKIAKAFAASFSSVIPLAASASFQR